MLVLGQAEITAGMRLGGVISHSEASLAELPTAPRVYSRLTAASQRMMASSGQVCHGIGYLVKELDLRWDLIHLFRAVPALASVSLCGGRSSPRPHFAIYVKCQYMEGAAGDLTHLYALQRHH